MAARKPSAKPIDLADSLLFRGLQPAELERVRKAGRAIKTKAGEELFHQDDPAKSIVVLTAGKVKLVQNTPDGRQVTLRFISPGEPVGIVAMLEDSVFPGTAQMTEAGEGLRWEKSTFQALMLEIPRIALNVIPFLISRVHDLQDRFRELATERVERRIARTLLRLVRQTGKKTEDGVDVGMPLSRQDLAEMNGTTLFTVSRVLTHWESQGLVRIGRRRVVILKPHSLVKLAEDLP